MSLTFLKQRRGSRSPCMLEDYIPFKTVVLLHVIPAGLVPLAQQSLPKTSKLSEVLCIDFIRNNDLILLNLYIAPAAWCIIKCQWWRYNHRSYQWTFSTEQNLNDALFKFLFTTGIVCIGKSCWFRMQLLGSHLSTYVLIIGWLFRYVIIKALQNNRCITNHSNKQVRVVIP